MKILTIDKSHMPLYIASDHAGYKMKTKIINALKKNNIVVSDLGTDSTERTDYPLYAKKLCQKIIVENGFGILLCGTGFGICIAANKIKKIRAVNVTTPKTAKFAVLHNNINVVCLSGKHTSFRKNWKILPNVLQTQYATDERHQKRINQISDLEKGSL